jgi:hypothetical protein
MTKRSSIVAASKEAEREIARQLGGRRLHAGEWSGMGGQGDVDVLGADFAAQVKHRSGVPAYITEGFKQIRDAVAKASLTPLMIIRTKPGSGRKAETFVMMDVATWRRIRGLEENQ